MGTWSCPNTEANAEKLYEIMSKPLPRISAEKLLYDLCGDDKLFDVFYECDAYEDIRCLVKSRIEFWLDNLDQFIKPWEPKAIEICRKIVDAQQPEERDDFRID